MEDSQIVELFFARSEDAISELDQKYGKSFTTSSRTTSSRARRTPKSV